LIVEYLGHSSFYLKDGDTTLLTDPYGPGMGYQLPNRKAEMVTVSHQHPDHNCIEGVPGKTRVFTQAGKFGYMGVEITGILSAHGGGEPVLNLIYCWQMGGIKFAHLGDLGDILNQEQLSAMLPVDVLMVPVGGGYTLGPREAFRLIGEIKPQVVIPMHYLTARMDRNLVPLKPVQDFMELFDKAQVSQRRDGRLELNPQDLGKIPQLQVMTSIF